MCHMFDTLNDKFVDRMRDSLAVEMLATNGQQLDKDRIEQVNFKGPARKLRATLTLDDDSTHVLPRTYTLLDVIRMAIGRPTSSK